MKTKAKIIKAVEKVAQKYNAKIYWGKENGITWLTLYGGDIHPKKFDKITKNLSKTTQVDCYFHSCRINEIQVAMDAQLDYIMTEHEYIDVEDDDIPEPYREGRLKEYGELIK